MSANMNEWGLGEEAKQANPLLIIHRTLRGRYTITIVLALIFGFAGGTAGYLSREPLYRSTGLVRIRPMLPKVLYENEQNQAPRMYANFLNTQAQLITTGDVIENAMASDAWRGIRGQTELDTVQEVQDKLVVRADLRGQQELVAVYLESTDPVVSQTVVNAVLASYIQKYGREGSIRVPEIVRVLEQRLNEYKGLSAQLQASIDRITKKWQTTDLAPLIQEQVLRREQVELQLEDIQRQVEFYKGLRTARSDGDSEPFSVEEAANIDPMIADWYEQKQLLENNKIEMMASEGLREEHRDVRRITLMIENFDSRIQQRIEEMYSAGGEGLLNQSGDQYGLLIQDQEKLEAQLAKINRDAEALFNDNNELIKLREEKEQIESSLSLVQSRLDTIDTESLVEDIDTISGRITIEQRGSLATSPTSDPRKKMAFAGFVGASSIPVGVIFALGFFSHRVKYSDDDVLSGADAGIVGMLPDLGNSLDDRELASASAFAVHQLRSQLQIKHADQKSLVYGVTSPAPGDGKTSLIIAMGLSFAEGGSKTLLLDLDFIGRGLSIHFGHSRSPSLAEGIDDPERVNALIQETEFPGMSILPAGYGDDLRVSRMSPAGIRQLLAPLREQYDTILIDTGPILGSVEAAFVSPEADGMLLVVGRGQYKPLIRKAIDQIKSLGGTIAATIFNRASSYELRHSGSSMSVHFSRQFSRQQMQFEGGGGLGGPLAGTMSNGKHTNGVKQRAKDSQS